MTFSSLADSRSGRSAMLTTTLATKPATAQKAPSPSISVYLRATGAHLLGLFGAFVGDDVDVDAVGLAQDAGDDRLADQLLPAWAVRLAEHDLGDGELLRRLDHGLGHVARPAEHGGAELPAEPLGGLHRLVHPGGLLLVGGLDVEHVHPPGGATGQGSRPPNTLARVGTAVDA